MTQHIERSGAGVKKDLATTLMNSANARDKLANDPAFRADLAKSKQGRVALRKIDRAAATSKTTPAKRSITVREAGPYKPGSADGPFYWGDKVRIADAERHHNGLIDMGMRTNGMSEPGFPRRGDGTLENARARVAAAERSITTAGSGGAGFLPVGYLGDQFDTAARLTGRIREMVTVMPMPNKGMVIHLPHFITGTTADVQTEAALASDTDPTTDQLEAKVVSIAGTINVTRQWIERSGPIGDQAIQADLGADAARVLDVQCFTGDGTGANLLGLLNTTGITSTTYTDASPTVAEWRQKVWTTQRDVIAASGLEPDVLAVGPTRSAWAWGGLDTSSRQMLGIDLPARPTIVQVMPTNLGAGSNQDRVLLWNREAVHLHLGPVTFHAYPDADGAGSGLVRLVARMYAALVVRRPSAVGVLSGTGCVVPSI